MRRRVVKIIISFILFLSAIIIPFKYEVINQIIFLVSYILVGYEIVKEAIEDAKKNAILNNITNAEFIGAPAEEKINDLVDEIDVFL